MANFVLDNVVVECSATKAELIPGEHRCRQKDMEQLVTYCSWYLATLLLAARRRDAS
jgi:hypothetical protein